MLGASLLAVLGATAAAPPVEIALAGREVRIADVAALTGFGPAAHPRFASRVIASIPRGRNRLSMTRDALAGLVGRSVPGLAGRMMPGAGTVTFRAFPRAVDANEIPGGCSATAQPIARGATLTPADIVTVPCDAGLVDAEPSTLRSASTAVRRRCVRRWRSPPERVSDASRFQALPTWTAATG